MTNVEVTKEFTFDAAHSLPGYRGDCGRLHGHTYKLEITVDGGVNQWTGMVCDFKDLKAMVQDCILRHLDHSHLNEIGLRGFPSMMPTAEKMVVWMAEVLHDNIFKSNLPFQLRRVRLWETPTSHATWSRVK